MKEFIFSILLTGIVCGTVWAVGSDMGAGTEPLTDGSETYPYLIEDLDDFDEFAGNSAYWASEVHTKLMTDIYLSGRTYTTAVIAPNSGTTTNFRGTPYRGVFDGNDFTIINLTINTDSVNNHFLGLFGKISGSGANIRDLHITNITIIGATSDFSGGVCGYNYRGTINNCHVTGSIIGDDMLGLLCGMNDEGLVNFSSTKGTITGEDRVGGLCGGNEENQITNCYSTASVNGQDKPLSVGGLLGNNDSGLITNCYATGTVTSTGGARSIGGLCGMNAYGTVSKCYFAGLLIEGIGSTQVGALCGKALLGTVNDCYFLSTSGLDNGLGIPLTNMQMKKQSNFINWQFSDTDGDPADWLMLREGEDYPRLAWQEIFTGDIAGLYGVDLIDFTYLSQYWGLDDCNGVDDCGRADIDNSGDVGLSDLVEVSNDWLQDK